MKRTKNIKSFYNDDRLNRGYKSQTNEISVNNRSFYDASLLPPIEVLNAYEDQFPGTFEKILTLAEKEQDQKYRLEQASLEMNYRASRMGMVFGLLLSAVICFGGLKILAIDIFSGIIFFICAFGSIFGVSFISFLTKNSRKSKRHNQ
ncbi:MAG: DUF2335 domain-containing protein [Rickettsiaceae bacterium]|nr:DUF2335 domain-containing protein [Rickettsiaceae bacterium]